jgi:hypothetical protein
LLLALIAALAGVSLSLIWLVDQLDQPRLGKPVLSEERPPAEGE